MQSLSLSAFVNMTAITLCNHYQHPSSPTSFIIFTIITIWLLSTFMIIIMIIIMNIITTIIIIIIIIQQIRVNPAKDSSQPGWELRREFRHPTL